MSIACPGQRPGLTLHRSSEDGDIICPRISSRVGDTVLRRKPLLLRCPEIVMVRIHLLLLLCISSSVFAQQLQVPEIEFQSAPDPLKIPADLYLGEAAGVAVNSKGNSTAGEADQAGRCGGADGDRNRLAYVPPHLLVHASATPSRREGNRSCCDTLTFARR